MDLMAHRLYALVYLSFDQKYKIYCAALKKMESEVWYEEIANHKPDNDCSSAVSS